MSALRRFYDGQTRIDFLKWWKRGLVLSAVLVVVSIVSLSTRGLNLGIDFEGGVSWEVSAPGVSVPEAREQLASVGLDGAKIQIVGSDILRVQGPETTPEAEAEVRQVLAELAGVDVGEVSVSTVGASWGGDITESAVRALVLFFIVILIYLSVRLEWRMAVAAIVAVIHDVVISVGVYSVFQFEVTPATVIAFLTILGYSIYDTIVVDDRIQENASMVGSGGRMTYSQMTSQAMNQVLPRSVNTTVTSLLPVISLLVVGSVIMGAVTLREFSVALLVGLLSGAYSSLFIASPVLVFLKEREPRFRAIRERLLAQGVDIGVTPDPATGVARQSGPTTVTTERPDDDAGPVVRPSGAIPPRPRKKGRRR